jgi:putative nucleotidyltransferase with HDIG domain
MTRNDAEELLKRYVANDRMLAHSYAAEAVLGALARRLDRDEALWGLAGLLHDIDIEAVAGDLTRHGLEAEGILREAGIDQEVVEAIKRHNERACLLERCSALQHALAAGETVTGLIAATALVHPDRKIAGVKVKSVTKRMKEKAFAASVNRETIRECELLGLPLDEFVGIALAAMQGIAGRLGL